MTLPHFLSAPPRLRAKKLVTRRREDAEDWAERTTSSFLRHAELVSASILPPAMLVREEEWTLKQVQGDERGMG